MATDMATEKYQYPRDLLRHVWRPSTQDIGELYLDDRINNLFNFHEDYNPQISFVMAKTKSAKRWNASMKMASWFYALSTELTTPPLLRESTNYIRWSWAFPLTHIPTNYTFVITGGTSVSVRLNHFGAGLFTTENDSRFAYADVNFTPNNVRYFQDIEFMLNHLATAI
ncbi:hypothetical protein [Rhodopirellula sallentina]|uniref:hypothetical protein n=1 Tax=Rhodopirellula sallentina TaxID=1263869 RepID=UPI0005C7E78D|nr:hypothetical protein [Rhodopirellula sallentina]